MATIHPAILPASIMTDPRRQAELFVFQSLSALPDPYQVFYDCRLHPVRGHDPFANQIDLLVAHPHLGILVLEVKGGRLRRNGLDLQQRHSDRVWRTIKPVEQVDLLARTLPKVLKSAGISQFIEIRCGLAFPRMPRASDIANVLSIAPDAILFEKDLVSPNATTTAINAMFDGSPADATFGPSYSRDHGGLLPAARRGVSCNGRQPGGT